MTEEQNYKRDIGNLVNAWKNISKLPKAITSEELLAKDFPPIAWLIPRYIASGFTVLAGAPKMGKSWLALGMACALASGGYVLGNIKVEECDVLYLALEDTERRLKERMSRMGVRGSPRLSILTEWPRGDAGVKALHSWMLEHPNTKGIFIDTLGAISGVEDGNNYQETYRATADLKKVADQFDVAIVVVYHSAKQARADFVDDVIGSRGLTGAADTIITMKRPRGQHNGVLSITGRDVVEEEKGIHFDVDVGSWTLMDFVPQEKKAWRNGFDGKAAAAGDRES